MPLTVHCSCLSRVVTYVLSHVSPGPCVLLFMCDFNFASVTATSCALCCGGSHKLCGISRCWFKLISESWFKPAAHTHMHAHTPDAIIKMLRRQGCRLGVTHLLRQLGHAVSLCVCLDRNKFVRSDRAGSALRSHRRAGPAPALDPKVLVAESARNKWSGSGVRATACGSGSL